jgi:ribosomal protein S18 acetylase RimI-like enzyme
MPLRPFRPEDAAAIAALAAACARGETDFVLQPLWETEEELFADFERHGIEPEEYLLVADAGDGAVLGAAGFLRFPGDPAAALVPPVVERGSRGRGLGGELLRGALELGRERDVKLASAALGSRNRAGTSLLTAFGFRSVRQHFLMRCERPLGAGGTPPVGFVLEPAGADDLPAISELYAEAGFPERTPETMRRALEDGHHAHVVARRRDGAPAGAGPVVGFVELDAFSRRRVWVSFVGVARELRERGLGSAMVRFALARAFAGSADHALLLLSPSNRAAVRAYEKAGFRRHRLIDVLERGL